VRSSPGFAALDLELPPVTIAARLTGILVLLAGSFVAWTLLAQGQDDLAALVAAATTLGYCLQLVRQRAARPGSMRLCLGADGALSLLAGNTLPAAATLGPGTRRLGPSVFLDLRVATAGGCRRVSLWLTPCDVATADLRRWMVVLPHCRSVACP
jgi:uncharacterized membrane protein YphA (DoxX/SURF4 family)